MNYLIVREREEIVGIIRDALKVSIFLRERILVFFYLLRGLEGPHFKELPLRYLFIDKVFCFC